MNSVNLIGRLTADPEIGSTNDGTSISKFSIAVDKRISQAKKEQMTSEGKSTADFPRIIVWDRLAESANSYLKKGHLVGITGRVTTGSYVKEDGTKIYTTDITASSVRFIQPPQKNDHELRDSPVGEVENETTSIPF